MAIEGFIARLRPAFTYCATPPACFILPLLMLVSSFTCALIPYCEIIFEDPTWIVAPFTGVQDTKTIMLLNSTH